MWACFCWLQKSWVCHLILKSMPSCPGLIPMLHSTIGPITGSVEHSLPHQWKPSCGGHLHFRERTFSKSATTFVNNNHMWYLFLIWWCLTILRWTVVTLCTLTTDIMWLLTLIILCLGLMTLLLHIRRQIGLGLVVFNLTLLNMGWGHMNNSWKVTPNV